MNFRQYDYLSPNFSIEYEKSHMNKSNSGAFLTFLLGIFVCIVSYIFCSELWLKEVPVITNTKVHQEETEISFTHFPIIFSLYNGSGNNVHGFDKYITTVLTQVIGPYTLEDDPNPQYYDDVYELIWCDITQEYEFYNGKDFGVLDMRCPTFVNDTDAVLRNQFLSDIAVSYRFKFYKCNPEVRECADDLDEVFESLTMYFTTVDEGSAPLIYNAEITQVERNVPIYLSNSFQKNLILTFDCKIRD